MVKEATNIDLLNELDNSLGTLQQALVQASDSVTTIRTSMAELATINTRVQELEATIAAARQTLSGGATAAPPPSPLRPVPAVDTFAQPAEAIEKPRAREAEPTAQPEPAPVTPITTPGDETEAHCLRLSVKSKGGPLELKAVDASVNENPAVVDVALLDYDGRQATLKLWVTGSADPNGVAEALLGSLKSRLGDKGDAEIKIEIEDAA